MSISNNENTEQMSILYNKVALAEKLDDLRHEKGLSLSKLSVLKPQVPALLFYNLIR